MTRNKRKAVIAVLMILAVALYFVSGTYARYADEFSGTASVDVAKWSVALKNGETEIDDEFELDFTVNDNEFVVSDKIAPQTSATAELTVDLTDTEVAVELLAEIDESSETYTEFLTALGASEEDVTLETKVVDNSGNDVGEYISLVDSAAFTSANGQYTVKITLTWTNNEDHNASDTTAGEEAPTLTVPVKVTVQQHIESSD